MTLIKELLEYNKQFVNEKKYEKYTTTKYPNKGMVIVTCMDTRLVELLPRAINVRNGDVKIIKTAGALVAHPFGSIMRSLLIAVYELQAEEVLIIGHYDCGMSGLKPDGIMENMRKRGKSEDVLDTITYSGVDVRDWLKGFDDVEESVAHSARMVKKHPLLPVDVPVHGLVIDPSTGELKVIVDGYEN